MGNQPNQPPNRKEQATQRLYFGPTSQTNDEVPADAEEQEGLLGPAGPVKQSQQPTQIVSGNSSTETVAGEEQTPVQDFGDYEILAELARGGMGVVYRARQKSLDRIVALKMILPNRLANAEAVKRFRQEAESAAKLQHPGIVPIYEIGTHNGTHYFTMPLIQGTSLASMLEKGAMQPQRAAKFIARVASAIEHAHSFGILHRDIKPENILVDYKGRPLLTDFGLAKVLGNDRHLTTPGQIFGSPCYIAPEQLAGRREQLGPPVDVYGLGVAMYEMLVGEPPFQGTSIPQTLLAVQMNEAAPPHQRNAAVPEELSRICMKCLQKDPEDRYPTAQALAIDLKLWLESLDAEDAIEEEEAPSRSRLPLLLSLVVILGAIALGVGWLVISSQPSSAEQLAALTDDRDRYRYAASLQLAANLQAKQRQDSALAVLELTPQGLRHWEFGCVHGLESGEADDSPTIQHAVFGVDAQDLWEVTAEQQLLRNGQPLDVRFDAAIHQLLAADGQTLLLARGATSLFVWTSDAENMRRPREIRLPADVQGKLTALAYAGEAKLVAVGTSSGQVFVGLLSDEGQVNWRQAGSMESPVTCLAIDPPATQVCLTSKDAALVLSLRENQQQPLEVQSPVTAAEFSPDGRRLFVACEDRTLRVYDPQISAALLLVDVTDKPLRVLRNFSSNQRRLLGFDSQGNSHYWLVNPWQKST